MDESQLVVAPPRRRTWLKVGALGLAVGAALAVASAAPRPRETVAQLSKTVHRALDDDGAAGRSSTSIFQSGSDLRYGRGSLPFDPLVRLTLSPPGMDKRFDVDEQPLITQDNIDDCFALIEVDFHKGEDQVLADTVVPALMRLREDHKRQPLY